MYRPVVFAPPRHITPATTLCCAGLLALSVAAPSLGSDEIFDDRRLELEQVMSRGVDLRDHLVTATVGYGEAGCTRWTGNRWECGLKPWLWVGRYQGTATRDGRASSRPCIWAHAESDGGKAVPLKIRFEHLPLGNVVRGEVALLDTPRSGGPVEFSVSIDGQRGVRMRLTDDKNQRYWRDYRIDTRPLRGRRVPIEFQITAKNASWRQVCFTGFLEAAP